MALFWQDSFESATGPDLGGGTRTATGHTNSTEGTQFNNSGDHFVRTNVYQDNSIGFNTPMSTTARGGDGDFYWRAEDVSRSTGSTNGDGTGDGVEGGGQLVWSGIDITGQTNIQFDGLILARQNNFIEATNTIEISYSIDGGASVVGARWIGSEVSGGNWNRDSNLDGIIDASDSGALSQPAFVNQTFDIVGTGSSLTLTLDVNDWLGEPAGRVNIGGGEEIGFDNFRLTSVAASGPDIDGDATRNILEGTAQNETINGFDGSDVLRGNDGDDTLNGGDGNDGLVGDAGADVLDGGNGIDSAVYFRDTSGNGVEIDLRDLSLSTGHAAGDTYISIERIFGTFDGDILNGDIEANFLHGWDGADVINGNNGDDILHGGNGEDILSGGNNNDSLFGGNDFDVLRGGNGDDYMNGGADGDNLFGQSGVDILYGGSGNDFLYGGVDGDVLIGGAGADTFVMLNDEGKDVIKDFEDGIDIISYNQTDDSFADLKFFQSGTNVVIFRAGNTDQLVVQNQVVADFTAADFNFVPAPVAGAPLDVAKALSESSTAAEYAAINFDSSSDAFDAGVDAAG